MIGCGPAGRLHLAAWRRVRTARIEAVLDIDPARSAAAGRDFHVGRNFAEIDRLLAEVRLDFVDICTSVDPRPLVAAQCLLAGLHVLAETPLAPTLDQARDLADLAAGRGRKLMVAYAERWRSAFRALKRVLDSGAVGSPHYARIFERRPLSRLAPADPARPGLSLARHLLVLEGLTGSFDLVRWLFGEVASVWGAIGHFNPAVRGEDFALAVLRAGALPVNVVLDVNWSAPLPGRAAKPAPLPALRIEGAGGALELDPQAGALLVRGHAGAPSERRLPAVPDRGLEPYLELAGHFAECLESGKPMENEGEEALAPLAAALAVHESAKSGGLVLLKKP